MTKGTVGIFVRKIPAERLDVWTSGHLDIWKYHHPATQVIHLPIYPVTQHTSSLITDSSYTSYQAHQGLHFSHDVLILSILLFLLPQSPFPQGPLHYVAIKKDIDQSK